VLGCGNSELSLHLRDAGYGHITSIDISEVCVQQLSDQYCGDDTLSFEVHDVKRMGFADASFDLVVDKATIDAVLIDRSAHFL
jgi:ubiquinone/menaquinone biosynthesis C-methylase UbiE